MSKINFLSKILEKVVLRQLSDHLLTNNLFYSISQLTMPVIAPRQRISRSLIVFCLLSMKTKSLSCLCLLPLVPLTTPFYCHVFFTHLAVLVLFLLSSLPVFLMALKAFCKWLQISRHSCRVNPKFAATKSRYCIDKMYVDSKL